MKRKYNSTHVSDRRRKPASRNRQAVKRTRLGLVATDESKDEGRRFGRYLELADIALRPDETH